MSDENVQSCTIFSNSKTAIFYELSNSDFSFFLISEENTTLVVSKINLKLIVQCHLCSTINTCTNVYSVYLYKCMLCQNNDYL